MALHIRHLSSLLLLLTLVIIGSGWFVSLHLQNVWDTSHWFVKSFLELNSFAGIQFQQQCFRSKNAVLQILACHFPYLLRILLFVVFVAVVYLMYRRWQGFGSKLLPIHMGQVGLFALVIIVLVGLNQLLAWSQLKFDQRMLLQKENGLIVGCIKSVRFHSTNGYPLLRFQLQLNAGVVDVSLPLESSYRGKSYQGKSVTNLTDALIGQCFLWQLELNKPRNFANQLPFNYEMHLLRRGILARGKVLAVNNMSVNNTHLLSFLIDKKLNSDQIKKRSLDGLDASHLDPYPVTQTFDDHSSRKTRVQQYWQQGLLAGDQSAFTAVQWQLAKSTGTLHLLVVSGLHMTLLVLLSFIVSKTAMGLLALTMGKTPHWRYLNARWLSFIIFTLVLVAGISQIQWGLSVIRSLMMIWLGLLIVYTGRYLNWALTILTLMALVSIAWPTLTIVTGFWYSFYSVLILVFFFQYRKGHAIEGFILPPWLLFFGLMPLSLYFALPVGWHQLLANLVAVPLMVLLLLPLTLATYLLPLPFLETCLSMVDLWFWQWLMWCDQLQWPRWVFMNPLQTSAWMALIMLGAVGANRWLLSGMFLIISILLSLQASRSNTAVTIFDVGQGQSIWLASGDYQMIIDTGQQYSEQFSIAQNIIRPALFKAGIKHIDHLVVSHDDLDHAGDIASLYRPPLDVNQLTMSQPLTAGQSSFTQSPLPLWQSCQLDDQWHKVSADFSYRFLQGPERLRTSDNNQSCVMQLDWFGTTILVPGDIDQIMERALVAKYGFQLISDVLVVAHHGSKSSSSLLWLKAVDPDHAIISSGYKNRFGHPHPEVIDRLYFYNQHIKLWNTAEQGAITIDKTGELSSVRLSASGERDETHKRD